MDELEMKKRIALALLSQPQPPGVPPVQAPVNLDELQMGVTPVIPDQSPIDPRQFLGDIQVGVPMKRVLSRGVGH